MFGFLIGTACLVGLIAVLRRGRGGWRGGYGRWGGGGWGGGGGFGPRMALRALFQRLDTTPGQEKVISQAFEEMRDAGRKAREEFRSSRGEVAKNMRGETFDAVMMGDLFGRHDRVLEDLRKAAVGSFSKVHDVLDERQRGVLADLIEHGGLFQGFGGRGMNEEGGEYGPGPRWGGGGWGGGGCGGRGWGHRGHHHHCGGC